MMDMPNMKKGKEKANKHGLMAPIIKVIGKTIRHQEKENFINLTAHFMKAILKTINFTGMENTLHPINRCFTKDSFSSTSFTVTVLKSRTHNITHTQVTSKTTINKDTEL